MDYDDILSVWGGFGVYDASITLILGVQLAFTSAMNLASNFFSPTHDHWCEVPLHGEHISDHNLYYSPWPPPHQSGWHSLELHIKAFDVGPVVRSSQFNDGYSPTASYPSINHA